MMLLASCAPAGSSPAPTYTIDPTAEAETLATRPWLSARLAPPAVPADASQADNGALTYYLICMACHGDRGQGLTDEWREVYGEDSNCWRSRCHASNHPPEGFDLPRNSPPLLGAGTLLTYSNASDLYVRILDTMPWWNPRSLSEEQAWDLTAYLMRARRELPESIVLDTARSPVVRLHQVPPPRGDERAGVTALIGLLVIAALALAWRRERRP
ncbi:MAG TPA: c-type cytochrome [Anaerolineales bacterium]|nr:c-type cytochrome [Anaerolineales bacterium]